MTALSMPATAVPSRVTSCSHRRPSAPQGAALARAPIADQDVAHVSLEERAKYPTVAQWQKVNEGLAAIDTAREKVKNIREKMDDPDLTADELKALENEIDHTVSRAVAPVAAARAHFEADAPDHAARSEQEPLLTDDELANLEEGGSVARAVDGPAIITPVQPAQAFKIAAVPGINPASAPVPQSEPTSPDTATDPSPHGPPTYG